MRELLVVATLVGNLTVTSYRALREQTDSSPYYTSTKEHVRAGGCAVSRDLLCDRCRRLHRRCNVSDSKSLHYGDWLYVERYGFRQVNDVMGDYTTQRINRKKIRIPIRRHIDIFVWTWDEEHAVGVQRLEVFLINATQTDPAQFDVCAGGAIKGEMKCVLRSLTSPSR